MAHRHRHRVQLQEVDAAGVVFYAGYFVMAHQAYEAALLEAGFDLADLLAAGRHALPMVHAEADYRRPLRYGDRVAIDCVCMRIGGRSFTLVYTIGAEPGGEVVAVVTHVHACVDLASQASAALPADLVGALGRLTAAP
jgi:1,4-dihydroxy-2-naphthoyl-CoA hydrolase